MMQVMKRKCKRNNNTSASNTNRVRAREKDNLQKKRFFSMFKHKALRLRFYRVKDSLSTKDLSTKELQWSHKTGVCNSNSQSCTQEVAQSQ